MGTIIKNGIIYSASSAISSSEGYVKRSGDTMTGALIITDSTASTSVSTGALRVSGGIGCQSNIYGDKVYGAVWNDYAEYRQCNNEYTAGTCLCESGDGTLEISTRRLQPAAMILSDTFGFAIGETEQCKIPVAVSGRVLAFPNENINKYKPGDAVCAGPNGSISRMNRLEIILFPDRIIGTVSEIPTYEEWGPNHIPVNGRIWIKI